MPGPRPGTGGAPPKSRKRVGRPLKYEPERVNRILKLLEGGNTRKAAALACGVTQATFCEWLNRFPEFSEQVEQAEARAEVKLVGFLRSLAPMERLAAQFILERRFHQDWRERKEQQVRVEIDDPLETLESSYRRTYDARRAREMASGADARDKSVAGS